MDMYERSVNCTHSKFPSDINMLRILWCDNANIIRAKAVHINASNVHASDFYVGISEAMQALPVMYDAPVRETGLSPVGEVHLTADLASFTPIPYAPCHGRAMGDMLKNGKPWACCPRSFLKKMNVEAHDMNVEVKGAFENEFYLLRTKEGKFEPVDATPFASTYAMDLNREIIDDIIRVLIAQGITVEQYYPESGPGQQEITIRYSSALQACDHQITFRETVRAVARKHGLMASFLPKIFPDKTGNGCHLHVSLWHDDTNILSDPNNTYGLSDTARQFIAGILNHLPALMALTTPTPNSYRRIQPNSWSGAFQCWGFDNKEAAIRVITDRDHEIRHLELKVIDASSNPYLALGAVIAAGLDGIREQLQLGRPVQQDPGYLSEDEHTKYNIAPLPSSLGDALIHLKNDVAVMRALGNELARAYIGVKNAEWDALKNLTFDEEVRLLLEKY
jgi:glutamine synthetase